MFDRISETAHQVLPPEARILLYGSRARGDARPESDWDLLILIPGERVTLSDATQYSFPFTALGWEINEEINPQIFTFDNWNSRKGRSIYQYEVERDGIEICH